MSKHTPGPWVADEYEPREQGLAVIATRNDGDIVPPTRGMVAWVHVGLGAGATQEIAEANARLIAAGPELLEACVAALDHLADHCCDDEQFINKLEAVIAKASDARDPQ